jgi:hypothetical protein
MSVHQSPQCDCLFCCLDLDSSNYAEFLPPSLSLPWRPSPYCSACIEQFFIAQQWNKYLKSIAEADCAAALRRVLNKPPPVRVEDKGFKTDESPEGIVGKFWFMDSDREVESKVTGSLEGDELIKFMEEKKAGLVALEAAEAESGDVALLQKEMAKGK